MKTTNFEISKKLKEAGYVGKTDLETILQALRKVKWFRCQISESEANFRYCEIYRDNKDELQELTFSINNLNGESLADTAGRMWLLLKEKGLV